VLHDSIPSQLDTQLNQSTSKDNLAPTQELHHSVEDKQFDEDMSQELESRVRHVLHVLDRIIYSGFKIQEMDSNGLETFLEIWGKEIKNAHQLTISNMWNQIISHVVLQIAKSSERGHGETIQKMEQEKAQLEEKHLAIVEQVNDMINLIQQHKKEKEELLQKIQKLDKEKDNVESSLSCAICFDSYVDKEPVCLDCGHIFCNSCIVTLLKTLGGFSHSCPTCRAPFSMDSIRELKGLGR